MIDLQPNVLKKHFLRQRKATEFHGRFCSFLTETGETSPKIAREGNDAYLPVDFLQGYKKDHIGTVTGIWTLIRTKHKYIRAVRIRWIQGCLGCCSWKRRERIITGGWRSKGHPGLKWCSTGFHARILCQ